MKELEDYHWFPQSFRRFQTDFIGFFVLKFQFYKPFVTHLKQLNWKGKQLDLCSGSGQPAISIFNDSNTFDNITLSDKFPDFHQPISNNIHFEMQSVDALTHVFESDVTYTMYNAFHHFTDAQKQLIVAKITEANAKAIFVEILNPNIVQIVKVLLAGTIGAFFLMPFVKPFSMKRLVFTYILPINLFTISYDGVVSVLKSKSIHQYKQLFSSSQVEVFKLNSLFQTLTVIQINSK